MKKVCAQFVISVLIAILCGYGLCELGIYAMGISDESRETEVYEDLMVVAKEYFVEKTEEIQYATALLLEYESMGIIRMGDGMPGIVLGTEVIPAKEYFEGTVTVEEYFGDQLDDDSECGSMTLAELLEDIFSENESECILYNIAVTDKAVQFYTGYDITGCVGFLYEKEAGNTEFYSTIEIMDNWVIFVNTECGEK